MTDESYDLMVHLVGGQVLPNYLGMKQFTAKRHVLAATAATEALAVRLEETSGLTCDKLMVDPYQIQPCMQSLHRAVRDAGKVAWNLTGGTKPMFAAAFAAARNHKGTGRIFYVNSESHTLDDLIPPFESQPLRGTLDRVSDFVRLAGFDIGNEGGGASSELLNERRGLTKSIGRRPGDFLQLITPMVRDPKRKRFENRGKTLLVEFGSDHGAEIKWRDKKFQFGADHDMRRYFTGGWLEELAFWHLEPRLRDGTLLDLRIGVQPDWKGSDKGSRVAQDFDVAATDGTTLYIVECKCFKPAQAEVQKLDNITRNFGGVFGRGILLANGKNHAVANRIEASRNLSLVSLDALRNGMESLLDTPPGVCRI